MNYRKLFLLLFLFVSQLVFSQTGYFEKQKRVDNKIKTISTYSCQPIFGNRDSCEILSVSTYDKKGNEIEVTGDPNKPYDSENYYKYNAAGQYLETKQIFRGDTTVTKNKYDSLGNRITSKSYKNGKLTSYYTNVYDHKKLVSTRSYSADNKLTSLSENKYDKNGNRIECLSFNGTDSSRTKYFYDENNKLVKTVECGSDNSVKNTKENFYENDTIVLMRITSKEGKGETKYEYDNKKRLIQLTSRDSGKTVHSVTQKYTYDSTGNLIEDYYYDDIYSGAISMNTYTYDQSGNLIRKMHSNNSVDPIVNTFVYDGKGRLVKLIMPNKIVEYTYDEKSGNKIREVNSEGKMITTNVYTYDAKNWLVNTKNYFTIPNDSMLLFMEIDYENNLLGKPIRATYKDYSLRVMMNAQRDTASKVPPGLLNAPPSITCIIYKYDAKDSLIETMSDKSCSKYGEMERPQKNFYDANEKLIEKDSYYPEGDQMQRKYLYEYDKSGNLVTEKQIIIAKPDFISSIIHYSYDSQNRLVDKYTFTATGEQTEHIRYFYDASGKVTEEKKILTEGNSFLKYEYTTY
jgi:hypothetical protein